MISYQTLNKALNYTLEDAIESLVNKRYPKESIYFTELKGGMSSRKLYTFSLNGKRYVLRTLNPKKEILERQSEIDAHAFAAALGIAPEIFYVGKEVTFFIMDYIDGRPLSSSDFKKEDILKSLGIMVSKLHACEGSFASYKPQAKRTQKHYESALKKEVALPSQYKVLYEDYIKQSTELQKGSQVLCHGDLNSANILLDKAGRLYLIDWPRITWDSPYTDLGFFSFLSGLNNDQSRLLLCSYLGKEPTQNQWEPLKLGQKRTSFLTASVWFDFSESEEEKSIPIEERVKKLDALLESSTLKMGQEYIQTGEIIPPLSGQTEAIKLYALGFLKTYITWAKIKRYAGA